MKSLILLTLLAAGVAVKSPRLKFVLQGKTVNDIYILCIYVFKSDYLCYYIDTNVSRPRAQYAWSRMDERSDIH